jgi:peptidoglycan/LPS O-acetylase OafA/YrhL
MAERIDNLDWVRGLASLWVVFHHACATAQKTKYFDFVGTPTILEAGHHGVDVFFILSGYVMMLAYERSTATGGAFLMRRLFRIWPLYLAVFLPLLASALAAGIPVVTVDIQFLISNLFLLPRDDATTFMPVVAWTLTHEVMFYLLFSVIYFTSKRLALTLIALWALACAIFSVADVRIAGTLMPLSPFNILFLVGIALYLGRSYLRRIPVALLFAASFVGVAVGVSAEYYPRSLGLVGGGQSAIFLHAVAYTLGFSAFVAAMSRDAIALPGVVERVATALGRWSYGLYLVHYPILVATAIGLTRWGFEGSDGFVALILIALPIAIFTSMTAYRLIEVPGMRWGRIVSRRLGLEAGAQNPPKSKMSVW